MKPSKTNLTLKIHNSIKKITILITVFICHITYYVNQTKMKQ